MESLNRLCLRKSSRLHMFQFPAEVDVEEWPPLDVAVTTHVAREEIATQTSMLCVQLPVRDNVEA